MKGVWAGMGQSGAIWYKDKESRGKWKEKIYFKNNPSNPDRYKDSFKNTF